MSYILDALKKSEQERGHGHIPSVQTVHTSSLNYSDKKTYWPYILVVAVVLNLAVIVYFYLNKNETPVATATSTEIDKVSTRENVQSGNDARLLVATPATRDNTINSTPQSNATQAVDIPSTSIAGTTDAGPAQQASVPPASITDSDSDNNTYGTQSYNTEPRDTGATKTEFIDSEVVDYYDLPESTRRRLPSFVVSSHVYSDNPALRSIVVNNNFLEEGERILDDLVLQEITPGGAIMNYRGVIFRYEIISGWQ